jgi:hypothetical protein
VLVCFSDARLVLRRGYKKFDSKLCSAPSGKVPGASQVTKPLRDSSAPYEIYFQATLVEPWAVKLVQPTRIGKNLWDERTQTAKLDPLRPLTDHGNGRYP